MARSSTFHELLEPLRVLRDADGRVLREYEVPGLGPATQSSPGASWVHTKDFIHGADGLLATRTHTGGQRFFLKDHLGIRTVRKHPVGLRELAFLQIA